MDFSFRYALPLFIVEASKLSSHQDWGFAK